jgi:NADH-quinone oxidoreductase subunit J
MSELALNNGLFSASATLIVVFSLMVVLARNPVRSTLLLIMSFLPTSLIYVMLKAPFVGILQILVYAGAIMMLFTFVVMMVNPRPEEGELGHLPGADPAGTRRIELNVLGGLAIAGIPLIIMVRSAAANLPLGPEHPSDFGELSSISKMIFENPMENPLTVSFELISFLVLVGIIAAINFSRRDPSQKKGTP